MRSLAREESEESPEESDLKKLTSVTGKGRQRRPRAMVEGTRDFSPLENKTSPLLAKPAVCISLESGKRARSPPPLAPRKFRKWST